MEGDEADRESSEEELVFITNNSSVDLLVQHTRCAFSFCHVAGITPASFAIRVNNYYSPHCLVKEVRGKTGSRD
jgi:hypothetical protein